MKKRILWAIFTIAMVLLVVAGCKLPFWSELLGSWVYSSGGEMATLIFDSTRLTFRVAGSMNGSIVFSLDDVDETAKHIKMAVTSTTGDFSSGGGPSIGSVVYMTYSISGGKTMYISMSDTDYPATAVAGPYTKQ
jgi:hypothetical protein